MSPPPEEVAPSPAAPASTSTARARGGAQTERRAASRSASRGTRAPSERRAAARAPSPAKRAAAPQAGLDEPASPSAIGLFDTPEPPPASATALLDALEPPSAMPRLSDAAARALAEAGLSDASPPGLDTPRPFQAPASAEAAPSSAAPDASELLEPDYPAPEAPPAVRVADTPVPVPAAARSATTPAPAPSIESDETLDAAAATAAFDAEIVEAVTSGDPRRALGLCAELHGENVGRLCMALLGTQTEADAVTEEVLLDAYRRAHELPEQESIRGWLLGLARHACSRRLERRTKRRNAADELPADNDRPERVRARQARAVLEQVRPSEREALVLRFAADASTRELAVACNIEPAEAQRRVSRALGRLREALESEASDD